VRTTTGGIGPIIDAVRRIGESLGMRVDTRVTTHPKIRLRAPFETGAGTMSIKIEVNTFERSPARPLHRVPFSTDSPWFTGSADVLTFDVAELVATKIRALYQRSRGRDLFDLWLALVQLGVPPGDIVDAFAPYRPDGYTSTLGEQNLRRKIGTDAFRSDLDQLVNRWPDGYDMHRMGGGITPRPQPGVTRANSAPVSALTRHSTIRPSAGHRRPQLPEDGNDR